MPANGRLPLASMYDERCKYSVSVSNVPNVFLIIFLRDLGYNYVIKKLFTCRQGAAVTLIGRVPIGNVAHRFLIFMFIFLYIDEIPHLLL